MQRLAYMKKKLLSPSPTPAGRTSRPAARNLTEMIGGGSMGRRSAATPTPHILRARENDEAGRGAAPGRGAGRDPGVLTWRGAQQDDRYRDSGAGIAHVPGLLWLLPDDEVIFAVPGER
jgi:hypothetical protein